MAKESILPLFTNAIEFPTMNYSNAVYPAMCILRISAAAIPFLGGRFTKTNGHIPQSSI
ncbi:MAG: hypothetical protein IKC46_03255 [Lachnospiraceae bacterium]|nr:hypothetical protein [Lachnospiraceae bacterium]